jgi:hypothetical protein
MAVSLAVLDKYTGIKDFMGSGEDFLHVPQEQ